MTRNKKPAPSPQKKTVEVEVSCDSSRVLNTIPVAIRYLQDMQKTLPPDAQLTEMRDGYEDWHFSFVYSRLETDEEFAVRLESERAEEERRVQAADRERQRHQEIEELRSRAHKLGMRLTR